MQIAYAPKHLTIYGPYESIFAKYTVDEAVPESLYWRPDGLLNHPFRELVRLKLCALRLESRLDGDDNQSQNLKIQRLLVTIL